MAALLEASAAGAALFPVIPLGRAPRKIRSLHTTQKHSKYIRLAVFVGQS